MVSAGIDLWDQGVRASIEDFQRTLATRLLKQGRSVIIEWGTWQRSEREALRIDARKVGAAAELHFLDVPVEVLWERIKARRLELTHGSRAPVFDEVESWAASLEPPTDEEIALFDRPPSHGGGNGVGKSVVFRALHHVQLAMPAGGEAEAEAFYSGILGLTRVGKPPHLEARDGCWFEAGGIRVHLGVESDFRPARKAHPALMVDDLEVLRTVLEEAGIGMVGDEPLPGFDRFYAFDPFGNRLEFLQPVGSHEGDPGQFEV